MGEVGLFSMVWNIREPYPRGDTHIACVFYLIRSVVMLMRCMGCWYAPILRTMITSMCVSAMSIREPDRVSREFFLETFSLVHLINTREPLFCFIRERNFQRGASTDYRRRSGFNKGGVPSARVCLSRVRKLTRIGHHTARCPYISPRIFRGVVLLESDSALKERTIDHEMISDSL